MELCSPCTIVILGVDPVLLDGDAEVSETAVQRYWDFLWEITDGRIQVVLEQTLIGASATAVHFVEAGYHCLLADMPADIRQQRGIPLDDHGVGCAESWDRQIQEYRVDQILRHLPTHDTDIALVVCRRQHVQHFAERLCTHAAHVKTIQAPPLDLTPAHAPAVPGT